MTLALAVLTWSLIVCVVGLFTVAVLWLLLVDVVAHFRRVRTDFEALNRARNVTGRVVK